VDRNAFVLETMHFRVFWWVRWRAFPFVFNNFLGSFGKNILLESSWPGINRGWCDSEEPKVVEMSICLIVHYGWRELGGMDG
jgi:hypothetical protein